MVIRKELLEILNREYLNRRVKLPYELTVEEIEKAVEKTYLLLSGLNSSLTSSGFETLDKMLLANSFSGIVSEFLIKNLDKESSTLVANTRVGGHPDLLPKDLHELDSTLRGEEGIEVKCSTNKGGWQGHNPERTWLLVFRYRIKPEFEFIEILCAKVFKSEWNYSGRKTNSRRTPTATLNKKGIEKLRENFVYRVPGVGVGKHKDTLAKIKRY